MMKNEIFSPQNYSCGRTYGAILSNSHEFHSLEWALEMAVVWVIKLLLLRSESTIRTSLCEAGGWDAVNPSILSFCFFKIAFN